MKDSFERVEELAEQAVGLFNKADLLIQAKDYNDAGILRDRAETILYEMMGVAIIFDSPSMWPILDIYKASETVQEYNGDDIPLLGIAYDMLKEYAKKTAKNIDVEE